MRKVGRKSEEPLSVETILKYTPENMILAACVLVLFFAQYCYYYFAWN